MFFIEITTNKAIIKLRIKAYLFNNVVDIGINTLFSAEVVYMHLMKWVVLKC